MAKIEIHRLRNMGARLGLGLVLLLLSSSHAYEIRVPESGGQAETIVQVPVILDDATEVASVKVQVNYNAQLLTLLSVTNPAGTLGEAFSMQYENDGDSATLILYREDHLVSGSGVLAYLQFLINTGAEVGAYSELVVADLGLGNEQGKDLGWSSVLTPSNSRVWVVMSSSIDSDGDGLSDYEEQSYNGSLDYDPYNAVTNPAGGDLDIHNSDSDGDGMTDGEESLAGTGALDPDSAFDVINPWVLPAKDIVISWPSITGRLYRVDRATNLASEITFLPLVDSVAPFPPINTYTDTTAGAKASLFYRISVWRNE